MYTRSISRAAMPAILGALALLGTHEASAQSRRVTVPENTVVRVRLDDKLSSRTAMRGDRFTATLADEDRSGLPSGTRFEGVLSEVRRSTREEPGVLDMDFRRVILADGASMPVVGTLASLADDDVRRSSDGRLEARRNDSSGGKMQTKWVGYGAGAGAVLATVFGGGFLKGALLGGLGGAVYGYLNKDKDRGGRNFSEVDLAQGQEFGIRLNQQIAFADNGRYRFTRNDRLDRADDRFDRTDVRPGRDRVLGRREELRFGSTAVRVNGRAVDFTDVRPMNVNGVLYVPLRPIAEAANMRFDHFAGAENFTLTTPGGPVRGTVGERNTLSRGAATDTLNDAPMSIDGEVYVSTEYLSRVADLRVNWDRRTRQLELESYR